MKKLTCLFIILLFCFAIIYANQTSNLVIPTDYRYAVAKKVFDDLVEAKGVKNMPIPNFILVQSERNVAWSKKEKAEIGLELKAYDICADFGKDSLNALAAILAHEVTHYYEKHGWTELFANANPEVASAQHLEDSEAHLTQELQADYLGGFLAYAAGYDALEIMPHFLEKVYQKYGFESEMSGYPTLEERQQTAKASFEKCQLLIAVFEMANNMVAIKDYSNARLYYEYILKDFQSRELYNNLGIITSMEAMSLFSKKELKYGYPFELDVESRLQSAKKGGMVDFSKQKEQREKLLNEALEHFKTAILLDENYGSGYLNLGCVYALLNETDDAEYFGRKAIKYANKTKNQKLISDVHILLGIISINNEDGEEALSFFEKAVASNNYLGQINKAILNGNLLNEAIKSTTQIPSNKLQIEGISLDKIAIQLEREELEPTSMIELNSKTVFAILEKEHSKILIHLKPYDEQYLIIHLTKDSYRNLAESNFKIGTSMNEILEKHQNPAHRIQLTNGSILIYAKHKLIFNFGANNLLKEWSVFRNSD